MIGCHQFHSQQVCSTLLTLLFHYGKSVDPVVGRTTLPFCTVAILLFRFSMTLTFHVPGNATLQLWNNFSQIFCWDQYLSVPMWIAGKHEQIVTAYKLLTILMLLQKRFAMIHPRNGLSNSNAVHPLKYLCPISVLRIKWRESVVWLLIPHPTCALTAVQYSFN